jgi:hypothetical protein
MQQSQLLNLSISILEQKISDFCHQHPSQLQNKVRLKFQYLFESNQDLRSEINMVHLFDWFRSHTGQKIDGYVKQQTTYNRKYAIFSVFIQHYSLRQEEELPHPTIFKKMNSSYFFLVS